LADSWPQLQDAVRIFIGTPNHDAKRLYNGLTGPKYGFSLRWSALWEIREGPLLADLDFPGFSGQPDAP